MTIFFGSAGVAAYNIYVEPICKAFIPSNIAIGERDRQARVYPNRHERIFRHSSHRGDIAQIACRALSYQPGRESRRRLKWTSSMSISQVKSKYLLPVHLITAVSSPTPLMTVLSVRIFFAMRLISPISPTSLSSSILVSFVVARRREARRKTMLSLDCFGTLCLAMTEYGILNIPFSVTIAVISAFGVMSNAGYTLSILRSDQFSA